MLVFDNDAATILVCRVCGGSIRPGQPFIFRGEEPIHSESGDCDPDEGGNPQLDPE
jgi:hypothetical protein